eukprot:Opistho-1_new@25413
MPGWGWSCRRVPCPPAALRIRSPSSSPLSAICSAAALEASPQLIKVPVPVGRVVGSVYQRGECPASISVAELAKKRVSYFRGTRFVELLLPAQALMEANDNWDALRRLQRGLSDYALDVELVSDLNLIRHGVTGLCKIAEPVVIVPLFPCTLR